MSFNSQQRLIGYVGLGIMGAPAARRLLGAGFELCVWARRREQLADFEKINAVCAESLADLADACDVVFLNLTDTAAVEDVVFREGGLAAGMRARGGIIVDMSTISPGATRQIAERLAVDHIDFVDAPVSGGERGAIDGTLAFMLGGRAEVIAQIEPMLAAMGRVFTHVGEVGAGQVAKMCNQIVIGASILGIGEAFRLASANGVDLAAVRTALLGGFAGSKSLEVHGARMIEGDFAPGFKTALHHKDINIALENAREHDAALATGELFRQYLQRLIDSGGGALDSAAIYTVLMNEAAQKAQKK